MLSSPALSGSFSTTISAQVASRSVRQMSCPLWTPGATLPGQQQAYGLAYWYASTELLAPSLLVSRGLPASAAALLGATI